MTHGNGARGFDKMFRAVGPFVAMAAMGGLMAARANWGGGKFADTIDGKFAPGPGKGGKFRFNGREGVALADLDMAADAPHAVVLASGDQVVIEQGEDFAITLQGDDNAKGRVRFALEDGALFIMQDGGIENSGETGRATVTVTMPTPDKLTIAGSGQITAKALAEKAEIVIAGSGRVIAPALAVQQLDLSIAGSGQFEADGTAALLDLTVAGSGNASMADLLVNTAKVSIAGSGNVVFACDGAVKAHLMGSGMVTVRGAARCKVQLVGSGCLVCEPRPAGDHGEAA